MAIPVSTLLSRSLAAAMQPASVSETNQYLTFLLAGEMYAVGILSVMEIVECGNLTDIPMMPAFIRGVINLRGSVVPVVDLAVRFGHARSEVGKRSCIVIIELRQDDGRHDFGILVDAVSEVLEIPAGEIESPPSFGAGIHADFITGMGRLAGRFVILLDIQRMLSRSDDRALQHGR